MIDTSWLFIDGARVPPRAPRRSRSSIPTTAEVVTHVPRGLRPMSTVRSPPRGGLRELVGDARCDARRVPPQDLGRDSRARRGARGARGDRRRHAGLLRSLHARRSFPPRPSRTWPTTSSSSSSRHARAPCCSCASRSAWSAASRPGTTRCTRSPRRSHPRSPPAAPSSSSRARSRRCRLALAELLECVGLPAGVFNMVSGLGPVVGEALATHPTSTWSASPARCAAGTRVAELAAASVKRVTLELGGKSPNVVLDDTEDLQDVVDGAVSGVTYNAGQTCSALTRLIVPRARLAEVEAIARGAAEARASGIRRSTRRSSGRWSRAPSTTACASTSRSASRRARAW